VTRWEAPAKLNLSLLVGPPRPDGYHPVTSLIQTIEWTDLLEFKDIDDSADQLELDHEELDADDNLVLRALAEARAMLSFPPQLVRLDKQIPVGAGLGGGSSDAAATLMAARSRSGMSAADTEAIAARLGADVSLFLIGGTMTVSGIGEIVSPMRPLADVAFAVVVPPFRLETAAVYAAWDRLGGPVGETMEIRSVPPLLRDGMPIRNDLLPAAFDVEPDLAEFMAEVRAVWGQPVALTGSGSACFGFFPTADEAQDAAESVAHLCDESRGVPPRPNGAAGARGVGTDER
jgi:4-diphosphocytidyl-2-C-methyl-D-erythritol kinase